MSTSLLDSLNEQQLEIATADPCDMFVVAGAGTGKTKVLISRVAYLVSAQECKPWQILAVTFTNKAAEEMRNRLASALGWDDDDTKSLVVTTFHGFCNKVLHRHAIEAGLPSEFSIITTSDQKSLLKRLYTQYGIKNNESYGDLKDAEIDLRSVLSRINNEKQKDISPTVDPKKLKTIRANLDQTWEHYDTEDLYQILFACYCQECEASGVLDFNDLLNRTKQLLLNNPNIREYYSRRFKYIFIDEFQDTNTIQYQIMMLIKSKHNHIMAVGDDDQGIYAWRGADIANLKRIEQDLPLIEKKELTINYRSSQNILTFANAIISYNDDRLIEKFLTAPDVYQKLTNYDIDLLLTLPREEVCKTISFVSEEGSELNKRAIALLNADDFSYSETLKALPASIRKETIDALIFNKIITPKQAQERTKLSWRVTQDKEYPAVNIVKCFSDASYVNRAIQILTESGCEYKDIAVLYRNNSLSSPIESMLMEERIPYQVYGGTKFYERSEIVLVLCYLRLMVNAKDDIAFEQVLNVPRRGMGEAYISKIKSYARSCGLSCYEALSMVIKSGDRATVNAFKKAIPFYELIESLKQEMYTLKLQELIESVLAKSKLDEYFKELDTKEHSARFGVSRMDNIAQLIINAAALQEKPHSNLNELALKIEDAMIGDDGTEVSNYEVFIQAIQDDENEDDYEVDESKYDSNDKADDDSDTEAKESHAVADGFEDENADEQDEDEERSQLNALTAAKVAAAPLLYSADAELDDDEQDPDDDESAANRGSVIVLPDGTKISQFDVLLNFISGVALISSVESNEKGQNGDKDDNCIKLMTIHASKGLEFHAVIIVGFEENILPSVFNENEEEERRLAYVAVTRAKRHLFMGFCSERRIYNNRVENVKSSRFIREAVALLKDMGTKPYVIKKA